MCFSGELTDLGISRANAMIKLDRVPVFPDLNKMQESFLPVEPEWSTTSIATFPAPPGMENAICRHFEGPSVFKTHPHGCV